MTARVVNYHAASIMIRPISGTRCRKWPENFWGGNEEKGSSIWTKSRKTHAKGETLSQQVDGEDAILRTNE